MDLNNGIDEQVSNRVDAYRGNPQQLMQMYQQNQELVDLLALQKLKSEKDAAKRQIEMQMQQQPGTVKQQREQELMQMTKDDLAKQTQGVLQRKQQQQQANLQRAAKGGLNAIAPRRPAPVPAQAPKPMMAGGGIVAFQPGGSVLGDSAADLGGYGDAISGRGENVGKAIEQYYADFGITNQDEWSRTPADVKERIAGAVKAKVLASGGAAVAAIPFAELNDMLLDPFKALGNLGIAASNTDLGVAMGLSDARNPNELYQYNTNRKRMQDTLLTNKPTGLLQGQGLPEGSAQKVSKPYVNKEGDIENMPLSAFANPLVTTRKERKLSGNSNLAGYFDPDAPAGSRIALPLDKRNATKAAARPFDANSIASSTALPADRTGYIGGMDMDAGLPAITTPAPAPATKAEAETTAVDDAMAAVNTQMAGLPAISGGGTGGAEAALMRGVGIGEDVLGRGEKSARFAQMEADLAALDEELYDPEEERRDQLKAFLIGTANTTNFGSTMSGGAAASLNLRNRQEQDRRQRMVDRISLGERGMTMDTELGKAALSLGNQMFADYNANQRTAMSAAATLGASKLRATVDMAQLEFNKDKEKNAQKFRYDELDIRKLENSTKQAYNNELSATRRNDAILRGIASAEKIIVGVQESAAERFGLPDLQAALSFAQSGGDEQEIKDAKMAFDMANAEATAYAFEILGELPVLDRVNDLERMFLELNGIEAMPGIDPTDITDVQPKR